MTIFGAYAQFYDTLYGDKDYVAECAFLEDTFNRYSNQPVRSVLDLGCGTGGHASILANRGYAVTGVDRSEQMLTVARRGAVDHGLVTWQSADIRDLDLDQTFDAVISMFAVVSYMVTNTDLMAALRTARRHLRPGGLFLFDAWFGPAVLTERPTDRYKTVEADGQRVVCFVHPELDLLQHTVNVHYKVWQLQDERVVSEVDEEHPVRFLFPQEIIHYLDEARFRVRRLCPFLRPDDDLSDRDWNLFVAAEGR